MAEALLIVAGLAFIIVIVGLNLAFAALRRRFMSWILGRAVRSVERVGVIAELTGAPEEEPRQGLGAMFDVMEGRNTDAVKPQKRTGAAPAEAGTAVEDLQDRDRK